VFGLQALQLLLEQEQEKGGAEARIPKVLQLVQKAHLA